MKKLMLSVAVAAFAFGLSPALAQDDSGVKLNLGGHFKGYANYTNQDDGGVFASDARDFDFLRQTEVHFGGETTLDNGLTVGAHIEALADQGESFDIDESYVYLAGSWGRVNFGDEDGSAYLLQVAAPSADDNVDGLRQFINPVALNPALAATTDIDYANDLAGDSDKITYLSPVFSGFQAGVSYTPQTASASRALNGNIVDTANDGALEDAMEAAARYEGVFNTVGVILGAGYTHASDDTDQWNVGVDLDIGAFGVGAVYTDLDSDALADKETWVAGVDYTTGPFKVGFSYLNQDTDAFAELDRYTGGVVYSYGPGMSFRGSVSYLDADSNVAGVDDGDATSVLLGTQINF